MKDRLIVAIDEPTEGRALTLIDSLGSDVRWLKIGMTLFYNAGPAIVRRLLADGWSIFLDLKCHDIPHQVRGAVASLSDLGVGLITVHTAGGPKMLEAAVEGAAGTSTQILGVTVLTSMDQAALEATGVTGESRSLVEARARLALASGLDGVVASPLEAAAIRSIVPDGFEIVTPGIRPAGASSDDQKRIATPASAIQSGATRLVVGRPITRAPQPGASARAILTEIGAALS
jgi:orotidine-5'-phosphate decarboxylase